MKQHFSYCSKLSIKNNLVQLAAGVFLIVVPIVSPFGLKIGATRILGPLPTTIILILTGLYILFLVFSRYRETRILAANNCFITVEDDNITYPILKKGTVTEGCFIKSEISDLDYNQEDSILTIVLKNGQTIEFDGDFFESIDSFQEFAQLLQK